MDAIAHWPTLLRIDLQRSDSRSFCAISLFSILLRLLLRLLETTAALFELPLLTLVFLVRIIKVRWLEILRRGELNSLCVASSHGLLEWILGLFRVISKHSC